MNRFYVPFQAGLENIWIDSSESHHILHVKRLKIGNNVVLFNGMGVECDARIVEIERKLARLKKTQPQAAAEVSRLAELGDFSENVEYQLAKGRLRSIINTILKLENQLRNAVLIEPEKGAGTIT